MRILSTSRKWAALAIVGLTSPLFAQSGSPRYPLTASDVADMLHESGISVTAAQVKVPPFLNAVTPRAKLRVTSADLMASGTLRARITCVSAPQCVPFFVTIDGLEHASSVLAALRSVVGDQYRSTGDRPLLQAGQRAILLMQNEFMRITVPVILIDSGRPGSEVRVSSLDRKQIFHGVVTDGQTVRGTLQ